MAGIQCTPLNLGNFAPAEAFVRQAGWNQVDADWRLMLSFGKGWGMSRDDRLIGTVVALPYGKQFGWISMMLIDKAEQGRGIGRQLMQTALAEWDKEGRIAALDATPAGKPLYEKLGFREAYTISRFACEDCEISPATGPEGLEIRPLNATRFPDVIDRDLSVFGADRAHVLANLMGRKPELALGAFRDGKMLGYAFGRDGRIATQIGPIISNSTNIATSLLRACRTHAPGPLRIDVPKAKADFVDVLLRSGFKAERDLFRMWRSPRSFGDATDLFAIAGPELG